MNKAILKHTQVSVILSLNFIRRTDDSDQLVTLNLIHLTSLIMMLWLFRQMVNRVGFGLRILTEGIQARLTIIGKVISIGFSALVWGIGL